MLVPILLLLSAFATASVGFEPKVFDAHGKERQIESLVEDISTARGVFIGESHDRYDQHLSELEIIRRLYERNPNRWAIGVEFIQRPFQPALDAYIAGEIDEREFLRRTEYFDRWGFDFRLYRPIFQFAREHGIPMVALNAPRELSENVGKVGVEGLSAALREQLPRDMDKSDKDYRKRLEKIFKQHAGGPGSNFEHFWEAQLIWDESMAERAAEYLTSHPEKAIVVLAGSGHIEFGSGIPNRVRRRLPAINTAILITADKPQKKSHLTDYSLVSKEEVLPPAPKMGLVTERHDGVRVKEVTAGGPAAIMGIKPNDQVVKIDGEDVKSLGDFRLALLDKKPGDRITMRIHRNNAAGPEDLTFDLTLQR